MNTAGRVCCRGKSPRLFFLPVIILENRDRFVVTATHFQRFGIIKPMLIKVLLDLIFPFLMKRSSHCTFALLSRNVRCCSGELCAAIGGWMDVRRLALCAMGRRPVRAKRAVVWEVWGWCGHGSRGWPHGRSPRARFLRVRPPGLAPGKAFPRQSSRAWPPWIWPHGIWPHRLGPRDWSPGICSRRLGPSGLGPRAWPPGLGPPGFTPGIYPPGFTPEI